MQVTYDLTNTLRSQDHGHPPLIYDARGNGGGFDMSDYHGRSPEQGDGLHGDCRYFRMSDFGAYDRTDMAGTIKTSGGGLGMETLILEPICFRDDITIKIDGGGRSVHSGGKRL